MALQNSTISPMHLFLSQEYSIPNYQRAYSWEKDSLDDFWSDIVETMEDEDNNIHFFGQVVVHESTEERKKWIIDGQQRTTTSMILLRALQTHYQSLYESSKDEDANNQAIDIESKYIGRTGRRHLILGEADNDYFVDQILTHLPQDCSKSNNKSHERLRKAYVFLDGKIHELLNGKSDSDKLDILNALFDAFTKLFKVLYMEATKLEEAFVIFETLNARGQELETADLLKNYILSQDPQDVDTPLNLWNSMINKLDKCDPTKYIRAFWNSAWPICNEKYLYKKISNTITTPLSTRAFLESLEANAEFYRNISQPQDAPTFADQDLVNSLIALKALKATTFYPVVIAMNRCDNFTEQDMAKVVSCIETYVFRNFTICGNTANSAEVFFAGIANDIYNETLSSVADICNMIKGGMVDDNVFQEAFKIWSGTKASKEAVRYIFRKVHKRLAPTSTLNLDKHEAYIEFIMPEDNSKWQVTADIHADYLWRLGNLCLLDNSLSGNSNEPIATKLPYYDASQIAPNKEIKNYLVLGDWNPESINKRQEALSQLAILIWAK
ncbi:DUF262 domain-containing protein [Fibrobacter sp. UWEL]|uniref:DUF262 domain-containing protein n=1 Tax=Fibrobacter sp. UWEL TaxID=1896209 RepID=UPI00091416C8|nr:DUF262 domain-containing protein [Fibrobacter sp. UWEL]SHL34539.1 Protein of unknown function [Fibrobacter sp. UWEL]